MTERELPYNGEAEIGVLGSVFYDPAVLFDVVDVVGVGDFYHEAHRLIFEAILRVAEDADGDGVSALTVRDELRRHNKLDEAGGEAYLVRIVDTVPTAANAVYFARRVSEASERRAIIEASEAAATKARDAAVPIEDAVEFADRVISSATERRRATGLTLVRDVVKDVISRIENPEPDGIPFPLSDVNAKIAGLRRSDVYLIAARPSVGKSALGLHAAQWAAASGVPTLFLSLEMTARDCVLRMAAQRATLPFDLISDPKFLDLASADEERKLRETLARIAVYPLALEVRASVTPADIRAMAHRLHRQRGLGLVVVDYLQLVTANAENRTREVGIVSRSLKALAMELDVPVLALSQLNRDVEKRDGKPKLADLRDSGDLEQDASVVMLLHEADPEGSATKPVRSVDVIIAKNRHGPRATVPVIFSPRFMRFENRSFRDP